MKNNKNIQVKESLTIIKIGGKLIDDETLLRDVLLSFSNIKGVKILVHGGGNIATEYANRLGIKAELIDGRRITDEDTLDVILMVYGGLINKNIVAKLQALGDNAMGLSGADGDIILSHKRIHTEIDYGMVGDIDRVNDTVLNQLIVSGLIPVLCPLTHNGEGLILNTNADTIAAEIAIAMSSHYLVSLKYCFEYPGVMKDIDRDTEPILRLDYAFAEQLKKENIIHTGLLPKIDNALRAKKEGVQSVCLCGIDHLLNTEMATWIH